MFILKKIGCRLFQAAFRAAQPFLPYREPQVVSSCSALGDVFKKEKSRAALIVTDAGIVKNGLVSSLEEVLQKHEITYVIYDKTQPNPTTDNVEEALCLYRKYQCDTLIAIGGGSSMDCAKVIGACAVYPQKQIRQMRGVLRVMRKLPTLIAIPTTAGTGSETTLAAVITDSKTHHKYALMSFPLIPHYAVLDPSFTYTLPPHLTATTGMDALTHAVEAYIGRSTNRETRMLALEATKLIFDHIKDAYRDGRDSRAREAMLLAAYKAGIAFSKSYVGYIHAIAHSLGGKYGTPHGLANAVIMPYVLEEYGTCIDKKLQQLGIAAGVCTEKDRHQEAAGKFINAVKKLNAEMDIPCRIAGIRAEDVPEMAKHAEKEANPLYPVPKLMTQKELAGFYRRIGDIHEKN
ncbi:MAG: iron-containing alcohol dehydrogenase [Clostridia bacterium]|nr:iron-containing alcohol dehydrogenase [Clostridia bacterium]